MIKINGVSLFTPGGHSILTDINWQLAENDHWVLYGPNGSGKTKLLELVTGYQYPSGGVITRFGERHGDIRELRKKIGCVSTPLRELFNYEETLLNVVLSGLFASIGLFDETTQAQREHARSLLEPAGLASRAADPFGILSDGEKQKVLMARAYIGSPRLLIFDEPARGLDLGAREDLLDSLLTMGSRHRASIIYVTHHTEEIIPLFEKICILEKGKQLYCGDLRGGLTGENLSRLFGRNIGVREAGGRFYTTVH